MQPLSFSKVRSILCLGAHSDDIEIGAGGAIFNLANAYPGLAIHWVVFSASGQRKIEAETSAREFVGNSADCTLDLHEFRDGFFPFAGSEIKDRFEALKGVCSPDLIFTHHRADMHQDHRIVGELTWNTFRDHTILEYEIPKYEGGLVTPNTYVELDERTMHRKIEILMDIFATQRRRSWFKAENFRALALLRGLEANASTGYAEGFHCAKLTFSFGR